MGLNTIATIALTFFFIFQCSPVSHAWLSWNGTSQGKCVDTIASAYATTACCIFFDMVVLCMPIQQVYQLKLSKLKKIQVIAVFCVGGLATTISVYRIPTIYNFSKNMENFTHSVTPILYLSQIEIDFAIFCACMPAMRPLLRRAFPKTMATTRNQTRLRSSTYAQGTADSTNTKITMTVRHSVKELEDELGPIQAANMFDRPDPVPRPAPADDDTDNPNSVVVSNQVPACQVFKIYPQSDKQG